MLTPDQSRLLDVKPTFATLLGHDLHEIAGLHVHQVIHPDDISIGSPRTQSTYMRTQEPKRGNTDRRKFE
ncbi:MULTISPECIES: PAS domain-containing protein [unclassified Rhodococcus (in: high G+C Gram-positive bacteria)]|uniref:PAS domain-containing protein n=1 Tax=unclassified Rhodococcus (in: high G+C Gram-positive bacteria) TaxID=192944 RepID=UPI000316A05C|nr:PAS domain-containing protein [Rhodococcus sp. DK17]